MGVKLLQLTYATERRGVHKKGQRLFLPVGFFALTDNVNATKQSPNKDAARIILPSGVTILVQESVDDIVEFIRDYEELP